MNIICVFGGKSLEHDISIISAVEVMNSIKGKYNVIPVYASKDNEFYSNKRMFDLKYFKKGKKILRGKDRVRFINKKGKGYVKKRKSILVDMVLLLVHGKGVEDGTILDYFRFKGFNVVGNKASFYSISQDKDITKKLLNALNISNVNYVKIDKNSDYSKYNFTYPCIVKPTCLGSSIGVSVCRDKTSLYLALSKAFCLDDSVIVEEYLSECKEYSIGVVKDNDKIVVSDIETINKKEIFDFKDKYINKNKKSRNVCLNKIDKNLKEEIIRISKRIYKEFNASGVIRIDYLYKDKLYVNEINAIPGSYCGYLFANRYDMLELVELVIKESKKYNYHYLKQNEVVKENIIFNL